MKKLISALFLGLLSFALLAQNPKKVNFKFTEASDLTLVGKIFEDTPNPYHRVDTVRYKGFTKTENKQVRMSSGIAVVFKTDSRIISVKTEYVHPGRPTNTNYFSARGYDLYIRQNGKWVFAGANCAADKNLEDNIVIIKDMDGSEHECLMYLPTYSEVKSVMIGVEQKASIAAIDNPFRHRIAIWGSSYTHGSSTSRAGMTYPAQLSRNTGLQLLSLGCSGNCKLQDYFCTALCDVNADAFIFDSFSNPSAEMIQERLLPFIERMVAAHPGKPLIFQQTIRRESRNFNVRIQKYDEDKIAMADSLMKIATAKYKDVYFIHPDASDPDHNASVDGTHPDNYGYTLWAKSIEEAVLKILQKYNLK